MDSQPDVQQMIAEGMKLLELMDPLIQTCNGYRAKLLAEGYSESMAEWMTGDFHAMMLKKM